MSRNLILQDGMDMREETTPPQFVRNTDSVKAGKCMMALICSIAVGQCMYVHTIYLIISIKIANI